MDGAYSPVSGRWFRLALLAVVLLLLSGTIAEAAITVQLFRFSAGRYVRFAVADTGTDLSGVSAPLEGLPIYVADEDTLYCYDGSTWSSCNAGGGGGAPTNAEYVVGALNGSLSAERVGTDTTEIDWDFGTAGQAKLNVFTNSLVLSRLKTSDTPSVGECLTVAASDEVAFAACGGGVTDHGALTGLTDDDHTQYPLLVGRSGGQTIQGGTVTDDELDLRANSAVVFPQLLLQGNATNPYVSASADSLTNYLIDNNGINFTFDDDGTETVRFTAANGGGSSVVSQFDKTGRVMGLRLCADSTGPDASGPCISENGSNRLFHDTNGDGVKDTGEEFIDQAGGGSITAGDGTTTVNPASTLAFDPTYFDVTDEGSGEAGITFVGSAAGDLAPYSQYDPNNQASSLGTSGWREEWTGDAASQTWTWGNQDSASETIDSDAVLLSGDGTDEFHARCTTAVATNADQTVTAKVWVENLANTNNGAGIGVVVAGTVATPTALEVLYYQNASSDGYLFLGMTSWALAGASAHGSVETFWPIYSVTQVPTYFQLRYTDSTRNLDAWMSFDGKVFRQVGSSTTISADPVAWCYLVRDDGDAVVEWIQNRTDANRNDAGE